MKDLLNKIEDDIERGDRTRESYFFRRMLISMIHLEAKLDRLTLDFRDSCEKVKKLNESIIVAQGEIRRLREE